jgi:hypothetical protein
MSAIDPRLASRRTIEFSAELIGRELASHEEVLRAFLATAGDPPIGSAERCRIAWALRDETLAWVRLYDYATDRALVASGHAIETGEDRAESIIKVALAAADRVLPGCHDRYSLAPLLRKQWLRIRTSPLSPTGRAW